MNNGLSDNTLESSRKITSLSTRSSSCRYLRVPAPAFIPHPLGGPFPQPQARNGLPQPKVSTTTYGLRSNILYSFSVSVNCFISVKKRATTVCRLCLIRIQVRATQTLFVNHRTSTIAFINLSMLNYTAVSVCG